MVTEIPKSYREAIVSSLKEKWINAMETEISILKDREVWEIVPRARNKTVIGCRWVYSIKENAEGQILRYKARLVAQGFHQVEGLDYRETFSPVVNFTLVRMFFILLVIRENWIHKHIDIECVYLYGSLNEKLYLEQPEGFQEKPKAGYVALLKKSLYGLHQSGRQWFKELDETFISIGFYKYKLHKLKDSAGLTVVANAIHDKIELLLKFLNNDDDEVSQGVIEFAREYLQFLKNKASAGAYTASDSANVETILFIVINKYKYDPSTDFSCQDQDEAFFQEYRKSLKVLFDNLALLDLDLVFSRTKSVITQTLNQWRNLPYNDTEVAITFLYLLGEVVPNCQGNPVGNTSDKKSEMHEMLHLLVTSGVSRQGHVAVILQFFETVVRFEKFFNQEPHHIPEILGAFLDERGLRNSDPHVRSRASYLLSRFVKCLKGHMPNYTEGILKQLQDLLDLQIPVNGVSTSLVSPDDQLYLYETAAILIVSGNFGPGSKQAILKSLLLPVAQKFEMLLQKLPNTSDESQRREIAKCMNHAIAVTSRTSKAFSNQQTMKSNGCVEVYLQALQIFLGALNLPYEQATLQSAVRQYLHRMVVCLESEVLPYFPIAAEQLLKSSDIRSIQEFIPLINQIIMKFKKEVVPFVQEIFMPFVTAIFNSLSVPIDENDQPAQSERQLLQRSYFLFIAAIVTNNITEVIAAQSMQNLERVLLTVIQGAVDYPDPVAQKTCFGILKKMVELWGGDSGMAGFVEFMYNHIVPACFMAPLKETFDLNDAQTILALSESALCLKTVLDKRGAEFVTYLKSRYLPTLHISPEKIEEYCQALASDSKAFKNYLKFFFQNAKT
ncbi:Exportin-T [Araneus ventricosus]|uniref:Exportin-T n=1 Tax=Araneus ventricosus TaxID=182803 RepID=A0A4Y2G0W3_ARAVE|nr:Exportin-T [Araneus ventricosus]